MGNEWHEASRLSQPIKKTRFRRISTSSSRESYSSDLDYKEVARQEENNFNKFIQGCVMKRLPVLSQTSPVVFGGYLEDLGQGDIAVLEVGESWIDSKNNLKAAHLEMLQKLAAQGVKIILNNRSFFREGSFEDELSEEAFANIKAAIGINPNIFAMQYVPTDSAYAKLAMIGDGQEKKLISCADMSSMHGPLGIRYVPSLGLIERGLVNVRQKLPQNIVLEGLVDGVVANSVVEVLQKNVSERNVIYSCGIYPAASDDAPYAASAEKAEMDKVRVTRSMNSASNQMAEVAARIPSCEAVESFKASAAVASQGSSPDGYVASCMS